MSQGAGCDVWEVSGLTIMSSRVRRRQASILYDCSKTWRVLLAIKRFASVQFSGKGRDMGMRILCFTKTLWRSMSETVSRASRSCRREIAASLASTGVSIFEMWSRKALWSGDASCRASSSPTTPFASSPSYSCGSQNPFEDPTEKQTTDPLILDGIDKFYRKKDTKWMYIMLYNSMDTMGTNLALQSVPTHW